MTPSTQRFTESTESWREINRVTEAIMGAAIEVHRVLGPGLLESACQKALAHELGLSELLFEQQRSCPVRYKDLRLEEAYRLDFIVKGLVGVEIKAIDHLFEVPEAQLLTYLKFTCCRIDLLINFRSEILIKGLRRLAL